MSIATTITIDPRLLVSWGTGSSYTIRITSNFVTEDGNNYSPSPVISQTITTPVSGPYVIASYPPTGSTATVISPSLTYNTPVHISTATSNFYLYNNTGNTLVATIPSTSTRISVTGTTISFNLVDLVQGNTVYYITADANIFYDTFNFLSPAFSGNTTLKFNPGNGPVFVSATPTYGQSGSFVGTATLNYDLLFTPHSGNYYIRNSTGIVKTISTSSSSFKYTGTTVTLTFLDVPLPEDDYYITNDNGVVWDANHLYTPAITDNSKIKWSNLTISNMTTRNYVVNSATSIFTTSTPIVLDVDVSTATSYTFSLASDQGTFTSTNGGSYISGKWVLSGTKTAINNALSTIQFNSSFTSTYINTFTYALSKAGTTLVNKTLPILGSMQSNSIPITISTNTGETYQGEAFTIGLSSTSSFSLSGTTATIYVDGIALPKVTFSGNTASISTIINSTGSAVGSHNISVTYNGGSIPGGWTVPTFVAATATQNITWHTIPSITLTANSSTYSTLQSRTMSMTLNTSTTINSSTSITLTDTRTYPIYSTLTTFLNTTTSISILEIGMTPISGYSPANGVNNTAAPGSSWGYPNRWYYVRVSNSTGLTVGNTINLQAYGNYKIGGTGPTINWSANSHYPITQIVNTGTNAYLVLGLYQESSNAVYTDDAIAGYAYYQSSPNTGGASISGDIPLSSVITSTSTFISGYNTTTNVYTATVINNTATFTIPANTGTGIHSSIGLWIGTRNVPYYFPAYTTTASYLVVPPSTATIAVSLSTGTYYYYSDQFGTVNTSSITATITVSNVGGVYSGRAPTGKVTIRDVVSGIISTGTLTTGTMTNSIINISWAPPSKSQGVDTIRNLTVTYEGDIWNSSSTNTSTSFSIVKPNPVFTISLASTGTLAYQTVVKDTYGNAGEIGFMATVPHQYPVTLKITKPAGVSYTGDIHVLNNNFGDVRLTSSSWSGNTATVTATIMSTGATSQILYTDQFHITYAGDSIHSNGDGGAGYADFYCYNTSTSQTELAYTYQTAFGGTVGYFGPATLYIKGT